MSSYSEAYLSHLFFLQKKYFDFMLQGRLSEAMETISVLISYVDDRFSMYLENEYKQTEAELSNKLLELETQLLDTSEKNTIYMNYSKEKIRQLYKKAIDALQSSGAFDMKIKMMREVV